MHIIFGNYGNATVGVIQWAKEQALAAVQVVSIDTGWAAQGWEQRVLQGEALAKRYGFKTVRLISKSNFAQLVEQQQHFPSTKYQWCAGFLKGLTFLDWLDEIDPEGAVVILLGKRRLQSPALANLTEFIEESEHYGERKIWHPLCYCPEQEWSDLLARAGLPRLLHRSLECDPCVNNNSRDFIFIKPSDLRKTVQLEKQLKQPMFIPASYADHNGIEQVVQWVKKQNKSATVTHPAISDMGCGSPFACGL